MEQYKYIATQYECINKPTVLRTISVEDVFQTIKNGDANLELIQKAREYGKGNTNYSYIKENKLLTHRFNFMIDTYALNKNITAPTGLIYLDADDTDTIPDSDYVFAKWRSLSNTGFGVLVKVENLTETNFKDTYNELSKIIGIKSDPGARSAIQQTVLSYDSNLYHNSNSITYTYIEKEEIKKVYFINTIKEEKGLLTKDTFLKPEDTDTFRGDNINDFFVGEFADAPFLVFPNDKAKICQPFIPNRIPKGMRHHTVICYLSNYLALNPHCDKEHLISISEDLLYKMEQKIPKNAVNRIIRYALKLRDEGSLNMYLNKERTILYNPKIKISRKDKYKITGREVGKIRSDKTSQEIYDTIESWDFEAHGKITQEKVAKVGNRHVGTVKKYWDNYKDYVKGLNADYKLSTKSSPQK